MKKGSYARIGRLYAKQHKYEFAIGCSCRIRDIRQIAGVMYAVVKLEQEPPEGELHTFVVPVADLKPITEEQAKFRLIEGR